MDASEPPGLLTAVVDDHLALLANLGVLDVPVDGPLLSVYGFQLRLAAAIGIDRAADGPLRRVAQEHRPNLSSWGELAASSPDVAFADPTAHAVAVARNRVDLGCNQLAAEVIALARDRDVPVRLTPPNARGQLREALQTAEVKVAVWTPVATGRGRVTVVETPE